MEELLGEYQPVFKPLEVSDFRDLLRFIEGSQEPCFLLPSVVQTLGEMGETFAAFEQWLNGRDLNLEENRRIRGRIVGRYLPREEYQVFFPVGGGKRYAGPHYVTAHTPADLDTAVASFWGWVDAFAARITSNVHYWNLPNLTPLIERLFCPLFGDKLLEVFPPQQLKGPGTVSLRDFCNRNETRIPPELAIISVVDHHRSALQTSAPATVLIADVTSCNTLVAEQQFRLSDRYSKPRGLAFVSPQRQFVENWMLLHAILDDTDLLDRVTLRDVECVAGLLNRLKGTRALEIEATRPKEAAAQLLKHPDLHSLYSKIYTRREAEVLRDLQACLAGKMSHLFADTKEQKGCARVGQTKLFSGNFPHFSQNADALRTVWLNQARTAYKRSPNLGLHVQMISTIAGADEVYSGKRGEYDHKDEIWVWVPHSEEALKRLDNYLSRFSKAAKVEFSVEILGPKLDRLQRAFARHFSAIATTPNVELEAPVAVLRFDAGKITSRKASITPHL